jgi:ActR/RegA family two-component response regulator
MDDALATRSPQTRRVLLVDDEERFTTQMAALLKKRAFAVVTAGDGRQALALVESQPFDAVVMDIRMPMMDGLTALGCIQAKQPAPAVIMLTGHASLETGIEAIRRGAFDYLMKPCDIEDLVSKLNVACTVGQIRRRPILWPRRLAGELILNAFRRIEDSDPLVEAFSTFNHRLPKMAGETLFIVDHQDRLTGHLSKKDILGCAARHQGFRTMTWAELSANPQWLPGVTVGEVMNPETVWVETATPLKQVADLMLQRGIRTLPVNDASRRVLGVVRLRDVLIYLDGAEETANGRFEE